MPRSLSARPKPSPSPPASRSRTGMADETRKFDVSLVTPDGPAFEGEAEMIIVPGAAGEIGVLARHAPLIATLKAGSTRVLSRPQAEDVREFATGPGFFKVEQDRALALVDDAVRRERDRRRARTRAARDRAARARARRARRVERRPLAARAAHQARREPARRLRPRLASAPCCGGLAIASACYASATRKALKAAWRPGYQTPKEPGAPRSRRPPL